MYWRGVAANGRSAHLRDGCDGKQAARKGPSPWSPHPRSEGRPLAPPPASWGVCARSSGRGRGEVLKEAGGPKAPPPPWVAPPPPRQALHGERSCEAESLPCKGGQGVRRGMAFPRAVSAGCVSPGHFPLGARLGVASPWVFISCHCEQQSRVERISALQRTWGSLRSSSDPPSAMRLGEDRAHAARGRAWERHAVPSSSWVSDYAGAGEGGAGSTSSIRLLSSCSSSPWRVK